MIELADGGVLGTNADLVTTRYAWAYDGLNRLVEEAYDGAGTGDDYISRYSFDDAGNRVLLEQDASPASAFGADSGGFLTIDVSAFTAVSTTTSVYDDNDRLLSEATDEDSDSVIDEFIQYDYAGTVQAAKTVHDGADSTATVAERTTYDYNARGRQDKVQIDNDGDSNFDVTTEYTYNDSGIRIKQVVTQDDQTSTTEFVINASNPTGYAQTIEEITDGSVTKSYTIGLDVTSQAVIDSNFNVALHSYLYDGHGSVRQLVDAVGQVVKAALDSIGGADVLKLDYDAYGQAINFAAATAVSSLLYSGEFTDVTTGQQYLRARFYEPATGRFNRVDPFAGDAESPQSLHKYLYGHGDPTTFTDPSGQFALDWGALIKGAVMLTLITTLVGSFISRRASLLAIIQSSGIYTPVNTTILTSLYHSVQIRNPNLSPNQIFIAMKNFQSRDLGPVLVSNNATPFGTVGFSMNVNTIKRGFYAIGQAVFLWE